MRLGWRMAGVRKMPLWQADTTTTVGRVPQPASRALSSVAGPTVPRAERSTKPVSSPWLVMKARHASPPPLRRALDTLAAVATSSAGLAAGSEVSTRMLRTPRRASLSRSASTPLSKAGLLLSPAISTTRQPPTATASTTGPAGPVAGRACGGGAPAVSGAQPATNSTPRRKAFRRTVPLRLSLRLGSHRAQGHLGVKSGHLFLAQFAARTVPHRDMGALVEQRHGDRLEIAMAVDLRRIEHALLDAFGQDADEDVADGATAAADVGDPLGIEPADLAVGDQRLDPEPAMAHDIDAHEGRELGARIVAGAGHRLLADALELA